MESYVAFFCQCQIFENLSCMKKKMLNFVSYRKKIYSQELQRLKKLKILRTCICKQSLYLVAGSVHIYAIKLLSVEDYYMMTAINIIFANNVNLAASVTD